MSKPSQQIIAEYAAFLNQSAAMLGMKSPDQVMEEAKSPAIPADKRKYYQPDATYNALINDGGFIPIMLYNQKEFRNEITEPQLTEKLKHWETMKSTYNAILKNPQTYDAAYEAWKKNVPQLNDDQKKALYSARIFQDKFVTHVNDAPFNDMFKPFSEKNKIVADCDTRSYLCSALMMDATDAKGAKIFTAADIKFDMAESHLRIRIKDKIIYETSIDASAFAGAGRPASEYDQEVSKLMAALKKKGIEARPVGGTKVANPAAGATDHLNSRVFPVGGQEDLDFQRNKGMGEVQAIHSAATMMSYQSYTGGHAIARSTEKEVNFLRSACLTSTAWEDEQLPDQYATALNNLFGDKYNAVITAANSKAPVDPKDFAVAYGAVKTLLEYAKDAEGYPEIAERQPDYQRGLAALKRISPVQSQALDAASAVHYGAGGQTTGQPAKARTPVVPGGR